MQRRRRVKQTVSLGVRLAEEAARLREQAGKMPRGLQRELVVRKARQVETAVNIDKWLAGPPSKPA